MTIYVPSPFSTSRPLASLPPVCADMALVVGLAALVVVLILAAQYESWLDPLAVVLIVPLAVLGAVVALLVRQFDNNLYTQVGLCCSLDWRPRMLYLSWNSRERGLQAPRTLSKQRWKDQGYVSGPFS